MIADGISSKKAEENKDYLKNIKKAEELLRDLIKKTEEVIEGKRKTLYKGE